MKAGIRQLPEWFEGGQSGKQQKKPSTTKDTKDHEAMVSFAPDREGVVAERFTSPATEVRAR
jgi:hypothetical protein